MATLPLDLDDLLRETASPSSVRPLMPAATRIRHVHVKFADLAAAEAFYGQVLGFEVAVRGLPGALFLAAGPVNTTITLASTPGIARAPPDRHMARSIFPRSYEVLPPSQAELERVLERLLDAGVAPEWDETAIRCHRSRSPMAPGLLRGSGLAVG
ncbi:MAG: VOC family protein [Solirubrobacteraceae bacterium]